MTKNNYPKLGRTYLVGLSHKLWPDFFDEQTRTDLAMRNIIFGSSLLLEVPEFNIPYPKHLVVIGETEDEVAFGVVVINTDVHPKVKNNQDLLDVQVYIPRKGNDFLKYDSFVDCSNILVYSKEEVASKIANDQSIAKGNVNEETMKEIKDAIMRARTISDRERKRFGIV